MAMRRTLADSEEVDKKRFREDDESENRKIFVGSLPPSVTEKPLVAHFRAFGHVVNCNVVRDRENGISKGFAFLTFLDESEAEAAVNFDGHILDGKPIRVTFAKRQKNVSSSAKNAKNNVDTITLPRDQTRIFIGPIEPDVTNSDLFAQVSQFGPLKNNQIGRHFTPTNSAYAIVDYRDAISVQRAFSNKIFLRGRLAKVTMSRLSMELMLSPTIMFFYEAHNVCSKQALEDHFSQFGDVFRAFHFGHEVGPVEEVRTFGFVDFIAEESVEKAVEQKHQLFGDQYIRVGRLLPGHLLNDLRAMGERYANEVVRKIEKEPQQGVWGKCSREKATGMNETPVTTAKVRIPSFMVGKLIGERGKNVTEICRDSNTKITIPRVDGGSNDKVVLTITGSKPNIKTAQYLMQKLLK